MYQVPTGGVAYALSPYQTASHPAPLPTSTVPAAPAKPAGGLDPAFLNTPAAQLVDTAIVSLNQQIPAINKFFATVGTNKLLTKLLNSAQSRSTCTVDPLTLGSLANQFIATMSQSRTELTAIVESVQKMVRAGAADDAPGAVRATTGIIDAIEPLGTKVKAVFPACAPAVLPAIAGYSGVPVRPAAVPVDAAQAADQLRDVARTLTALSSTSLIRAEADRANLNKLATIVETIGTALGNGLRRKRHILYKQKLHFPRCINSCCISFRNYVEKKFPLNVTSFQNIITYHFFHLVRIIKLIHLT
jgi:hypothetical protein